MAEASTEPKNLDVNGNQAEEDEDTWKKLTPEELVRGLTPADTERRCLELVQTYLGGSWAKAATVADITVKRISGGFTNQLYHVHLNETVERVDNAIYPEEPSDVAIKFYLEKHIKNYSQEDAERLNDIIVLTIMSETGLGPKVYGIFADGFIQGFYKHEQFRAKHQQDPTLLRRLAALIARIHHLNVPINKETNLLFQEMRKMIHFAYDQVKHITPLIDELNLETLQSRDLRVEFDWLMSTIEKLHCPAVFCHNDFRGSNILVTEPEGQVLACDLEYCGYGARGYDLATVLTEWGKSEMFQLLGEMPNDEQLSVFLKLYIAECDKLLPAYSTKAENSLASLLKETKVMFLANYIFFLAIMVKTQESIIPSVPFDAKKKMRHVEGVYKMYMAIKETLIKDGTIEKEI